MIKELTMENFNEEVGDSKVPVLVDFWAPWCGPCKNMMPMLEYLNSTVEGDQAKICKVNIDEQPQLAAQFGIRSVPTVLIFNGTNIEHQLVGMQSESTYRKALGLI